MWKKMYDGRKGIYSSEVRAYVNAAAFESLDENIVTYIREGHEVCIIDLNRSIE